MQTPPNKNIVPEKLNKSVKNGMNFSTRNELKNNTVLQIDIPNAFKFSGKISAVNVNDSVLIANDCDRTMNERQTIGIHLKALNE